MKKVQRSHSSNVNKLWTSILILVILTGFSTFFVHRNVVSAHILDNDITITITKDEIFTKLEMEQENAVEKINSEENFSLNYNDQSVEHLSNTVDFSGEKIIQNEQNGTAVMLEKDGSTNQKHVKNEAKSIDRITTSNKRHWCVVTHIHMSYYGSRRFKHFPHAAEVLLPCWSYFYEQDVRENCGIDFRIGKDPKIAEWTRQLVEIAMKCVIKDKNINPYKSGDVEYIPNLYHMRPRYQGIRWLNSPDHAHALRRNLISDNEIAKVKGEKHPLQIGLMQRNDTRRVDNLDEIRDALREALPEANIDIIEDFTIAMSIRDQAWNFASKDIIIGPHGAAMTNSIFITPKTAVLQMHPSGYFYQFFEGLIEQSGGIALDWHDKTAGDPYIQHKTNHKNRDIDKNGHMVVPPDDIVMRVLYFLGKKNPDHDQVAALYGNAWDMADMPLSKLQLIK